MTPPPIHGYSRQNSASFDKMKVMGRGKREKERKRGKKIKKDGKTEKVAA